MYQNKIAKLKQKQKEDKKLVPFVMKYYPSLHNLKQKFKESKIWHLIRNIQRTAPDIIQRRRFLRDIPVQVRK